MRGRNNNNNNNRGGGGKGGPNPLTRSYESNGPDVKIRGNAQQIAEKYAALARDAQSSGDRVMAENYLQHAEHYNRIIAAAQASMPAQNFQQNRDDFDDEDGDERDEADVQGISEQQSNGDGPQPVIDGVPAEVALNAESGAQEGESQNRNDNRNNRDFRERNRDRNRNRNIGSGNGEYQRREFQPRDDQRQDGLSQDAQRHEQNRDEEQPQAVREESVGDSLPAFVTGAQPPREEAPRRTRRPRRGEREQSSGEGDTANSAAQPEVAAVEE
jgi:hypothetical protein